MVIRHAVPFSVVSATAASESAPMPVVVVHGSIAPLPGPAEIVIRSSEAWQEFWRGLPTRQAAPEFDFDAVTLVAVVLATDNATFREPRIERSRLENGTLVVTWRAVTAPRPSTVAADAVLRPFVVAGVRGFRGPVRFEQAH